MRIKWVKSVFNRQVFLERDFHASSRWVVWLDRAELGDEPLVVLKFPVASSISDYHYQSSGTGTSRKMNANGLVFDKTSLPISRPDLFSSNFLSRIFHLKAANENIR
jgi:hypothetical protein